MTATAQIMIAGGMADPGHSHTLTPALTGDELRAQARAIRRHADYIDRMQAQERKQEQEQAAQRMHGQSVQAAFQSLKDMEQSMAKCKAPPKRVAYNVSAEKIHELVGAIDYLMDDIRDFYRINNLPYPDTNWAHRRMVAALQSVKADLDHDL